MSSFIIISDNCLIILIKEHENVSPIFMHERIRTANLPQFQLSPKEAMVIIGIASILSYLMGLAVGVLI